ncbi:MAG TPA: maleylpyruvate isomerase N-terminal domain-containing protein [Streptosporangiaceae bacterium]
MDLWPRARTLASFLDGVTVIGELAATFTTVDWHAPTPCGDWRAVDLAGHLRCVADDLGENLDTAPYGRLATLMAADVDAEERDRMLARQNAAELVALGRVTGPVSVRAFAAAARAHARRLPELWGRTYYRYRGDDVTVGEAVGALCVEWHVHAWDLARARGMDYRPADPATLLAGWRTGLPHRPVGGGDPWLAVLRAYGRGALAEGVSAPWSPKHAV